MTTNKDRANTETVLGCIEALREALQMAGRNEGYMDSLDVLEFEYRNEHKTDGNGDEDEHGCVGSDCRHSTHWST